MTELYLIRHAEAEGNIYRRLHGQFDSRLTANGLNQVEALRRRFADVSVDAVYASDLFRTRMTARSITEPKGLCLHTDARLREVSVGRWEGACFGWLERTQPEQLRRFLREPELWQADGAEDYEVFSGRFTRALADIARANEGKTVAVFTHGCILSAGLHRLFGMPHNASGSDNTGVSLLHWDGTSFTPVFLYDSSHLSESISTHARQRWWRERGGGFNLWFRDRLPEDEALFHPDFLPPAGHRLRVAMLKDEPVGYTAWQGGTLSLLYLKPEYRFRRMGDQLLGEALLAMRAEGRTDLTAGFPTVNRDVLCFLARHGASIVQMDDIYTVCRMDIRRPDSV